MSGKGSSPRPYSVDENWNTIFKNPVERDDAQIEDEAFNDVEKHKETTKKHP